MDEHALIERVYDHVESNAVDKAAVACLRLARKIGDSFNVVVFLRELYPDHHQLKVAFFEETQQLKKEAQDFLWKSTQRSWLEERSLDYSLAEDEDKKVLAMGVGDLIREVEQMEKSIEDLRLPPGMGEFDTAAFTDRHSQLKSRMRLKIQACHTILERIRTRCLNYATRIEQQLQAAGRASDFMASVQNDVHNYYAERSRTTYEKLRKAASLIGSKEPEDHALLLTAIRRGIIKRCVNKREGGVTFRFGQDRGFGRTRRKETPPWGSKTRKGLKSQEFIGSSWKNMLVLGCRSCCSRCWKKRSRSFWVGSDPSGGTRSIRRKDTGMVLGNRESFR